MKANEAPKKIYLEKVYPDNGVLPNGLNYTPSPTDIEYTRTDALIEKATTWIANRYQANGSYLCADDIEDFVKFMKGEKV